VEDNKVIKGGWKVDIFNEAKKLGLVTDDKWLMQLDEPASVWFVLSVAINILKRVVK
jgi:hypothetical protein